VRKTPGEEIHRGRICGRASPSARKKGGAQAFKQLLLRTRFWKGFHAPFKLSARRSAENERRKRKGEALLRPQGGMIGKKRKSHQWGGDEAAVSRQKDIKRKRHPPAEDPPPYLKDRGRTPSGKYRNEKRGEVCVGHEQKCRYPGRCQ